jgi:hypothetical protein
LRPFLRGRTLGTSGEGGTMFIQVIQGRVKDADALRRQLDRWREELMPGAAGYLGTTAGIADDGRFVGLARFESPEAAQANSDRAEQGAWWAELEKSFDGEPTFLNSTEVRTWLSGGSDDAGFVQVMQGTSPDVARMHELMTSRAEQIQQGRPEIIGGLLIDAGEGRYVHAIYFTSEDEARAGERKEIPDDLRAEMEEGMRLMGEVTYLDLHEPLLVSP